MIGDKVLLQKIDSIIPLIVNAKNNSNPLDSVVSEPDFRIWLRMDGRDYYYISSQQFVEGSLVYKNDFGLLDLIKKSIVPYSGPNAPIDSSGFYGPNNPPPPTNEK
ncbi:MAG: hypothetical protein IT233_12535 [Bacteroidia bacterium]|nr:hypothetical protein [Bacteroidia bacterium]